MYVPTILIQSSPFIKKTNSIEYRKELDTKEYKIKKRKKVKMAYYNPPTLILGSPRNTHSSMVFLSI